MSAIVGAHAADIGRQTIGCRLAVLVALLAACVPPGRPAASLAPGIPYEVDTLRDCSSLGRLLDRSRGPAPHMAPALWRVRSCPVRAGVTLAQALRDVRHSGDTATIQRATWLGHYLHDRQLFEAAVDVARDGRAGEWARIAALRTLLWTKAPSQMRSWLEAMLTVPACAAGCHSTYTGHYYQGMTTDDRWPWPAFGEPLPPFYADRIDRIATELAAAPTVPARVRRAAQHVKDVRAETRDLEGR